MHNENSRVAVIRFANMKLYERDQRRHTRKQQEDKIGKCGRKVTKKKKN